MEDDIQLEGDGNDSIQQEVFCEPGPLDWKVLAGLGISTAVILSGFAVNNPTISLVGGGMMLVAGYQFIKVVPKDEM